MLLNTSKYVPTFGMKRVATPQKSGSAPGRHCAGPMMAPSKDIGLRNVPLTSNASPCAFRLFWRDRTFPIPEQVALAFRIGCMRRSGHRFTEYLAPRYLSV